LNASQLRLAFPALVRSASSSTNVSTTESHNLAWYCVQLLLDTIHELSPLTMNDSDGKGKAEEAQLHRLQLALISTVSSLPQSLMLRCLDHIRNLISAYPRKPDSSVDVNDEATAKWGRKTELVEALFHEILEKISDQDLKGAAMSWWYRNLPMLIPEQNIVQSDLKDGTGRAVELKGKSPTEAGNDSLSLSGSVPQSRL